MKKYLAGGKAMAGSGCSFSRDFNSTAPLQQLEGKGVVLKTPSQYATPALGALIAERDKQINNLWNTITPSNTDTNQLVITQAKPAYNKSMDINTILDGDF